MHDYFDRKGGFALEASQHAVRLLYDLADEPTVLGDVSFSDPLLPQKMLALRSEARRLMTGDVTATVIIPTAYVLLRAFGGDFSLRHSQDVEVDEMLQQNRLRPDKVSVSCVSTIDAVVVAIVEIQTLLEAEGFAKLHGFAVSRFITCLPHDLHLPPFVFQAPAPIQ